MNSHAQLGHIDRGGCCIVNISKLDGFFEAVGDDEIVGTRRAGIRLVLGERTAAILVWESVATDCLAKVRLSLRTVGLLVGSQLIASGDAIKRPNSVTLYNNEVSSRGHWATQALLQVEGRLVAYEHLVPG